jgi:23S rRNA pseudouridine2605 synthase
MNQSQNKGKHSSSRVSKFQREGKKPGTKKTEGSVDKRERTTAPAKRKEGKKEGPAEISEQRNRKPIQQGGKRKLGGKRKQEVTGTFNQAGKGPRRKKRSGEEKPEEVRLNRYIAHAGICSRREADKLIEAGLVTINGKVVTELGTKVQPGDDVRYNSERLGNERKVYLLLNKPKDYVTTVDDPHAKKTVMELIGKACRERIYPVGRLDKNTTGVLLFTNDGDLTKRLTHPSFNKKKIYHVFLDKSLAHADLQKIAAGILLDDGFIQVDAIAYSSPDSKREVGLEIHSGKNRVVRRIFEHLGYKVTKLDRVYFAGLTKKNLPRGRWRFLTENEVKMLKMNAFE